MANQDDTKEAHLASPQVSGFLGIRILAGLVGIASLVIGPFVHQPTNSIWPRFTIPISIVAVGACFVYYAITGRRGPARALARLLLRR